MRQISLRAAVAAALASTAACSSLTDVPVPSNILDGGKLETQATAVSMYNNAIYLFALNFAGSYSGGDGSVAGVSGLFSDEYTAATYANAAVLHDTHSGTASDENQAGPYEGLQGMRQSADAAIAKLIANGGTAPKSYIGELHALKGYVYIFITELYCEGAPFGTLAATNGPVRYPESETRTQALNDAIAQFDSAVAVAGDSVRIARLAAVGKARAYLDLGDFANAKTAVAQVPTTFAYATTYSTTYANYMAPNLGYGPPVFMANLEGGNGLGYTITTDPRVARISKDGSAWTPSKFSTATAPVTLADGIEARLIEAEAALHDHDAATWASILNTLRATAGTTAIPALSADSTTTASDSLRINVMFRERAFWMFGTGHRQGDMRRLIRQYQRAPANVYPVGAESIYNLYIPTPVLEIPQAEADNNPKFHGCLNHNA